MRPPITHSSCAAIASVAIFTAVSALSLNSLAAPTSAATATSVADDQPIPKAPDMLRFTNGDTLHGNFLGFGENHTMLWKNPEASDAIEFSTKKTHRIIFNSGQAHQKVSHLSTITLTNGDVIPGHITAAGPKSIQLTTDHLGALTIQRDAVVQIAPNPFGGKLLYYGPLSTDGWKNLSQPEPKKDKEDKEDKEDANGEKAEKDTNKTEENNAQSNWKHIASAWYSGTDKYNHLVRENALPDQCRLSFKLAWRGSLYTNVAIHADFAPPAYDGKEDTRNNMAATVGHSYVVSISAHSATLYSCTFDKKGKPTSQRIDNTHVSLNLSSAEEAVFEFRIDRPNKQLLLFVDGEFKTKWDLGDEYEGKGDHLAFRNLRYNKGELRISDIVISRWNGLKDSAQSMRTPERDIILLTNGLDRFSGTFKHLKDDKITFHGTYNNELAIPVDEVQEVHFASSKLRKADAGEDHKMVHFYVFPYGRVSGIPSRAANGKALLLSELLGEINLDTSYINMIDFSHQNSILDLWDDKF